MIISSRFKELQRDLGISDLAATFADMSSMIASGSNTVDVFALLTQRIVELLPVRASGILLVDANSLLQVVGSSDHSAHQLDLYQLQNHSGPCLTACATGELVTDTELSANGPWPSFSALAREHHFSSVYALPLSGRKQVLGALNLFCDQPLSDRELTLARVLADSAAVALLQADPRNDAVVIARNTQSSIQSRNVIEQAKGVLSQRYSIDMNEAFRRIQTVAGAENIGIVELATHIAERTISDSVVRALNNA